MGKASNKGRSLIPQHQPDKLKEPTYLNRAVANKAYKNDGNKATVLVCLKYIQYDYECLSDWTKQEIHEFYAFLKSIHDYSWQQILEQGGKLGAKVGFGYTCLPRSYYPSEGFKSQISPDVDFFELRLSGKIRVHGFRDESIFYLCWLDRNHSITS